jgi:hypothetical protein
LKLLQESGKGRDEGEMVEEVKSCMVHLIHCKKLGKCHNVPPPITTIKGGGMETLKRFHV